MTDEEMRRRAEAASGGYWYDKGELDTALGGGLGVLGDEGERDAAFIATMSPAAVLALLDRIAELEAEVAKLRSERDTYYGIGAVRKERDEAREAVKRLAGALFDLLHGCSVDAPKNADEALADPVVKRIVEGG